MVPSLSDSGEDGSRLLGSEWESSGSILGNLSTPLQQYRLNIKGCVTIELVVHRSVSLKQVKVEWNYGSISHTCSLLEGGVPSLPVNCSTCRTMGRQLYINRF